MYRVTNGMLYNNALINSFRQNEGMLKAQEQISSGKRVNRPSDDPIAIGEIMTYNTRIDRNSQYLANAQKAETSMNTADSNVGSILEFGSRVRELVVGQLSASSDAQTRNITAKEVKALRDEAITIGNMQIGNSYIYGGRNTDSVAINANGLYTGDSTRRTTEVDQNASVDMAVLGSDFLASDLNPQLNANTAMASLRGGAGITSGTFTITDRAGTTGIVNITAGMTVGNIISAINGASANVTASIAGDGKGITITDNTAMASITGSLAITDTTNNAAKQLGIEGTKAVQYLVGSDLNPSATATTLLSDLKGGSGYTPSDVLIVNGATSATVSFSTATTLGDIITAINNSGTNTTAAMNANGSGITVTSNSTSTVAYAQDVSGGDTADFLGMGGGRNFLGTLAKVQLAMERNDTSALAGLLTNMESVINNAGSVRGEVGAQVNRITSTVARVEESNFNSTTLRSSAQDADMVKAATDLAMLQVAYQATIKSSASIIQPTLLDFIR